jgi:3-hydroxyacyl-CoA dehydrogenase
MQVGTIGVIGAGVMGSGIAQVAATKGIDVILLDVNEKALKTGINAVEGRLDRMVAKSVEPRLLPLLDVETDGALETVFDQIRSTFRCPDFVLHSDRGAEP